MKRAALFGTQSAASSSRKRVPPPSVRGCGQANNRRVRPRSSVVMRSGRGVTVARRAVVQMDEAEEKRQLEKMENERTKVDEVCDQITWENMKESIWGTDGKAG